MVPRYEEYFRNRGGVTPLDPLQFHLSHLARYWSRLIGVCRHLPTEAESCIDGDLGAWVAVGTMFVNRLVERADPVRELWDDYWRRVQAILHDRPVTLAEVETVSSAFESCLSAWDYDPWKSTPHD